MRIVSGREADAAVKSLESREARLTGLESRVRRIIEDVRRGGERSLRRFAEKWDGLGAKQSLQVPEQGDAGCAPSGFSRVAEFFAFGCA